MKLLRDSRIIRTFMVLVTLSCLMFAFNGCIIDDLREKFDVKNGHWHYNDKHERDGCLAGGTECIYGGTAASPR